MDEKDDNGLPKPIKAPKYLSDLSAVGAILKAQHAAVESAMRPYREMLRVQEEISRKAWEPFSAVIRTQQEIAKTLTSSYGAIFAAQTEIAKSLSRSLIEPFSAVLAAQQEISRSLFTQIADASEVTRRIAEISGLATQFGNIARFDFGIDFKALMTAAMQEAERLEDEEAARDNLFAGYEGDEFLPERKIIDAELAKIPDFDELPAPAKFVQVLNIAVKYPSSKVQAFALGMAGNLLAGILGQTNTVFWLTFFLIVAVMGQFSAKLRVPKTRQLLRTIPIDKRHTRIVDCRCAVFNQPKSKTPRIGRLEVGTVLTITDKMQGWREVYFVDPNGQQRVGWVRSKYLRKV